MSSSPNPPCSGLFVLVSKGGSKREVTHMNRRTFGKQLVGIIAAAKLSWGQGVKNRTVFYASVGGDLTVCGMDGRS